MWPFSRKKKQEKKTVPVTNARLRSERHSASVDDFSTSLINPVNPLNPLSPFSPLNPINWDTAREEERRPPSSGSAESYSYTPSWDSGSSGSSSDSSSSSYSSDSGGSSSSGSD